MTVSAVVFDLGGTLIEYAGTYERWPDLETPGFTAAYDYLRGQGVELPDFTRFRDLGFAALPGRWQGATAGAQNLRLIDFLAEVTQVCGVEAVEPAWLMEAAERYQAAVQAQAAPLPGARETVAHLKAEGYKLGLISNTMFAGKAHEADLERFGLIDYFDTMLFSADVNKWKPNPEPFIHVLEDLGVAPRAAVFVGDDPANDVIGGQRAGMRTVYYASSGRFSHPPEAQPDARIENLAELPPILARWQARHP
jgi:putative hydrolase of the HAD superfamily